MFEQAWKSLLDNSLIATSVTIAFFTIKGLMWLMVPLMMEHFRRRFRRMAKQEPRPSRELAITEICDLTD
jgi:hypothetical protein